MMKIIEPQLYFRFIGFGRAWPQGPARTNKELLKMNPAFAEASDLKLKLLSDRISQEIGFTQRYLSHFPGTPFDDSEETTESLGLKATRQAVGSRAQDIELFIHGTTTTRRYTGSQASSIMGSLEVVCPSYETKAGCSTSLACLHMAFSMLQFGYRNVLITTAETMSKVAHPDKRDDWFGMADGSGSVWLEKAEPDQAQVKVLKTFFSSNGKLVDLYTTPADLPPRQEGIDKKGYFLDGNALELRGHAKAHYIQMLNELLPTAADKKSLRWVVPHQISRTLTEEVKKEVGFSGELLWSAHEFGNLGGSSVVFTLAEALEKQVFQKGDRVLLMSVGGGLSFACQLWEFL